MKEKRQKYLSPQIEVIEMENESVMALSANGGLNGVGNGGDAFAPSSASRSRYNGANSNDLEDMINDILTVEP